MREVQQETESESPHPNGNPLDIRSWGECGANSRMVLEDFEATTGERNGAKVGGQGRVLKTRTTMLCFPREDEIEEVEDC